MASKWAGIIKVLHKPIIDALVALASVSVRNAKKTVAFIVALSLGAMAIGLLTNFNIDVDEDTLWAPRGSRPVNNFNWIEDQSGFPLTPRNFRIAVHSNGENVLGYEGVLRVFRALDTIRDTAGYAELCQAGSIQLDDGTSTCRLVSVATYWNNSLELFQDSVESDEQTVAILTQNTYPDGSPVDRDAIMGSAEFDDHGTLSKSPIYMIDIQLPRGENDDDDPADDFEDIALENIKELQDAWVAESGNRFRLEYFADRSFADEFERAIINDIGLVPIVFIIMSVFTSMVFFKWNKVQSRSTLGFGAVCCVLLAIMAGYGLLFICGTPFTSMTQILPFSK